MRCVRTFSTKIEARGLVAEVLVRDRVSDVGPGAERNGNGQDMLKLCSSSGPARPKKARCWRGREEPLTPLRLPEPDDAPMRRSPLSLVVCQIRHDRVLAVADSRRALEVQNRLEGRYPQIDERRSLAFALAGQMGGTPPAPMAQEGPSGWQFKSDDGAWTVTLDAEFFSLETSAYTSWIDFRARLESLSNAVLGVLEPALELRLGLRYVDEIVHPEVSSPTGWKGWVRGELLGPLAYEPFGHAIRAAQQQLEFDAGNGFRVTFRHGTAPITRDPGWVYVMDHDCFRQIGAPLSTGAILGATDDLHRIALQVFQNAITERLYRYLVGGDEE